MPQHTIVKRAFALFLVCRFKMGIPPLSLEELAMNTFVLHSGEQEIQLLLQTLAIPHGTALPSGWRGQAVIGWGKYRTESQNVLSMQPVHSILRCSDKRRRNTILHPHGLKTLSSHSTLPALKEEISFSYYYIIPVFQLDALTVYRRKGTSTFMLQGGIKQSVTYEDIGLNNSTYHVKRAVREAVKAVYVLGLDYAVVTIGVPASGHTLILEVNPEPKLSKRLAALFAKAIEQYDRHLDAALRQTKPVMLGADPEFLLLSSQGKIVAASRFVERAGEVGCDGVVQRGEQTLHPLAELRPEPSESPRELTRHVQHALQHAAQRFSDPSLRWVAGGMPVPGYALGGHIHLSRVLLHTPLLRALDNYLALPLLLAESEQSLRRRPRYGALGDCRRQPHGGFEYRTLPSWLASPILARGAFTLAKLIAENYSALTRRPLNDPEIQAMYYRGDKRGLLPVVITLWGDLEGLGAYAEFATELDELKNRLFRLETWDELTDIRNSWKISSPSSVPLPT